MATSTIPLQNGRRYGRFTPEPLPAHRMLSRVGADLPLVVDLREWAGPVKDQGQEGSCTAHAGSSAIEWIFRRYHHKQPVLSPQYLYAHELITQGDYPNDDGSDGVTLCNTMIQKGCCDLSLFPYVSGKISRPTLEQDQNAAQYRMGAFHGLTGEAVAISVLGDPVPWPVEIGFSVPESFASSETQRSGVMSLPKPGEQVLGGHEVLALGYDIGPEPTIRPQGCPAAVLIQNSWGTAWGIGGYFWMPVDVLGREDTDLKIAHSGHPWVVV